MTGYLKLVHLIKQKTAEGKIKWSKAYEHKYGAYVEEHSLTFHTIKGYLYVTEADHHASPVLDTDDLSQASRETLKLEELQQLIEEQVGEHEDDIIKKLEEL